MQSDVLIIGGGIAGVSAAARLASACNVTILEMEAAAGYHATGRSAAMFEEFYGNATLRALNRASKSYLAQENGGVMTPRGVLVVAAPLEVEVFENEILAAGFAEVTLREAREEIPALRCDKIKRAALDPEAYDIDVDLLLQNYLRKMRLAGGQIVFNANAHKITYSEGLWHVQTNDAIYTAPVLINAAGAWADNVAQMAGVIPLNIRPCRRSVARVPAPPGHDIRHWPMCLSATESWYCKPDAGKMLVSPADEDPVPAMDAWADDMVLAEGLDRYSKFIDHEITRVDANWAGLRSFAPDRTPVVGFDPSAPGFFWLAGQGGYGVQTSPAISALVYDLITQRPGALVPEVVSALNPARFG